MQTIVDDGRGDCLRASVCSVLDLDISEAPNFAEIGFFDGLDVWLRERGLRFIRFSIPRDGEWSHEMLWFDYLLPEDDPNYEPLYMLAWGQSPRSDASGKPRQHIVVAEPNGYGIRLAHDPHESGAGLVKYWGFGWIVKR